MTLPAIVTQLAAVKWGAVASGVAFAFLLGVDMMRDERGLLVRLGTAYIRRLERDLRAMLIFFPGERIFVAQASVAGLFLVANALFEVPCPPAWLLAIAILPPLWIRRMKEKRVQAIETQLAGTIQALANSLRTTPSIGAALAAACPVIPFPIRAELDLALKQMRLGSTVDQALVDMGARIGSNQVNVAFTSVLVGLKVGGNLPTILEGLAAALREMQRLEGVVRMKTASGKMQLWVLGSFPVAFVGIVNWVSPGYFQPLTVGTIGVALSVLAVGFWIGAVIAGRKIVSIEV